MGKQDVFKGALGWDDWIWWSGIGALGLFFLLVILCCIVCVQRAKRKGRDEAMAVVQARERERQQQEQAQLRYAQAQQVRYPAREPSYKFSKPEPPQASYNPYGHDDHQMHRNSYVQPPQPRPKPRRGSQFPPPTVDLDQQQSPAQQPPQALYAAVPARQSPASPPAPIQPSQPEELPQVAAYYGRKTNQEAPPIHSAPIVSQQYQRQQQVNPNQPPLMQYRRHSGRGTFNNGDDQSATTLSDVPFVQVNSPRTSNASTVSTTISSSVPAGGLYSFNQQRPGAGSTTSSFGRQSVTGGTLRDRIDALREGTPQDISRLTATAMSSGTNGSVSSSFTTSSLDNRYSSAPPPPQRLSQIASGTVLSDSSYATDDMGFDENAFDTARSSQVLNLPRPDSEGSIGSGDVDLSGQFEDAESPPHDRESYPSPPRRGRAGTNDSDGSIEF